MVWDTARLKLGEGGGQGSCDLRLFAQWYPHALFPYIILLRQINTLYLYTIPELLRLSSTSTINFLNTHRSTAHILFVRAIAYGRGPLNLYYALVFVSVVWWNQSWVVSVSLGSVITYSDTAATHSMTFAASCTQLASQLMLGNYEVAIVGNNKELQLQLPLLPTAWIQTSMKSWSLLGLISLWLSRYGPGPGLSKELKLRLNSSFGECYFWPA